MAAAPDFLSLKEFEDLYTGQKPHYEYWFGEAIQKPMATYLHGIMQLVLGMLLLRRGWTAGSEVRLKLSGLAHPVPDLVAGSAGMQSPYPTDPVDLCVEILSPNDTLRNTFAKCAHYLDWGVGSVWIIDPERRRAYVMTLNNLRPIEIGDSDALMAGHHEHAIAIKLSEIFEEVDRVIKK
jgi:Uma2 family endonuclease